MYHGKITLAFEGTLFTGWQKTGQGTSIEDALLSALSTIIPGNIHLEAASRTDSGVHAKGQVITAKLPKKFSKEHLTRILNSKLPHSIRILSIEEVAADFHPTIHSKSKTYEYLVDNHRIADPFKRHLAWHYPKPLDIDMMREGAKLMIGTHDFASFANLPRHPDTKRTIHSIEISEHDLLQFEVTGKSFLYKMVRNIIGTLVYLGAGKLTIQEVQALLTRTDRKLGGPSAPAHGLFLAKVIY